MAVFWQGFEKPTIENKSDLPRHIVREFETTGKVSVPLHNDIVPHYYPTGNTHPTPVEMDFDVEGVVPIIPPPEENKERPRHKEKVKKRGWIISRCE